MYAIHRVRGGWEVMLHGNAFLQYLDDAGDRGHDQVGSINWIMGMAHRNVGTGRLGLRGMFSLEPATIGGCGYPDLLASGERCNGEHVSVSSGGWGYAFSPVTPTGLVTSAQ